MQLGFFALSFCGGGVETKVRSGVDFCVKSRENWEMTLNYC